MTELIEPLLELFILLDVQLTENENNERPRL